MVSRAATGALLTDAERGGGEACRERRLTQTVVGARGWPWRARRRGGSDPPCARQRRSAASASNTRLNGRGSVRSSVTRRTRTNELSSRKAVADRVRAFRLASACGRSAARRAAARSSTTMPSDSSSRWCDAAHVVAVDGERRDRERIVDVVGVDALGQRAAFDEQPLRARARQRVDDARGRQFEELARQPVARLRSLVGGSSSPSATNSPTSTSQPAPCRARNRAAGASRRRRARSGGRPTTRDSARLVAARRRNGSSPKYRRSVTSVRAFILGLPGANGGPHDISISPRRAGSGRGRYRGCHGCATGSGAVDTQGPATTKLSDVSSAWLPSRYSVLAPSVYFSCAALSTRVSRNDRSPTDATAMPPLRARATRSIVPSRHAYVLSGGSTVSGRPVGTHAASSDASPARTAARRKLRDKAFKSVCSTLSYAPRMVNDAAALPLRVVRVPSMKTLLVLLLAQCALVSAGPAGAFTFADGAKAVCIARGEIVTEIDAEPGDPFKPQNRTALAERTADGWRITWNLERLNAPAARSPRLPVLPRMRARARSDRERARGQLRGPARHARGGPRGAGVRGDAAPVSFRPTTRTGTTRSGARTRARSGRRRRRPPAPAPAADGERRAGGNGERTAGAGSVAAGGGRERAERCADVTATSA